MGPQALLHSPAAGRLLASLLLLSSLGAVRASCGGTRVLTCLSMLTHRVDAFNQNANELSASAMNQCIHDCNVCETFLSGKLCPVYKPFIQGGAYMQGDCATDCGTWGREYMYRSLAWVVLAGFMFTYCICIRRIRTNIMLHKAGLPPQTGYWGLMPMYGVQKKVPLASFTEPQYEPMLAQESDRV